MRIIEEFKTKIDEVKNLVRAKLSESELLHFYNDKKIESYLADPFNYCCNSYRTALDIYDQIIMGEL